MPRNNGSLRRAARLPLIMLLALLCAALPPAGGAQQDRALSAAIQKIMDRPEYKHANFGIEFYDLASHSVVYEHDADKLFIPASTTKTLTEGALLANLGKDFRFHTRVFRPGPATRWRSAGSSPNRSGPTASAAWTVLF